jgi:hypothetical protein
MLELKRVRDDGDDGDGDDGGDSAADDGGTGDE